MPATPYHFGPGLLIKAAAPLQFSMAAYSLTQVVSDLESGYYLLHNYPPMRRRMQPFLGGGPVGFACRRGWLRAAGGPARPCAGKAHCDSDTAPRNPAPLVLTAGQQSPSILPRQALLSAERASEFPRP